MIEVRLEPAPRKESADEPTEAFLKLKEAVVPVGDACTLDASGATSSGSSIERSGDAAGRLSVVSTSLPLGGVRSCDAIIRTCLFGAPAPAELAVAMLDARRPTPRVTPRVKDLTFEEPGLGSMHEPPPLYSS